MEKLKTTTAIFKRVGETPLEALNRFRQNHPEYVDSKISYAGRLDPMAEGVLLLLIGDANKERVKYEQLDKEYECEFLLGISTDSYDILGKIKDINFRKYQKGRVESFFRNLVNASEQRVPPYSAKRVGGEYLYKLARENAIREVDIPKIDIRINSAELLSARYISKARLQDYIVKSIQKVKGDFRQEEIVKDWEEFFQKNISKYKIYKAKIECASGTYVRSIIHDLGENLETGGVVIKITRTRVGRYTATE